MVDIVEKIYLNHKRLVSSVISIITVVVYYLGWIKRITDNISNIVALDAAMLVVITLVLTILLYLGEKENFRFQLDKFSDGYKKIYSFLFYIILADIINMIILIIIAIVMFENIIQKLILCFIGMYSFSYMLLGALYMLWFSVYIVCNVEKEDKSVK